MSHFKGGMT